MQKKLEQVQGVTYHHKKLRSLRGHWLHICMYLVQQCLGMHEIREACYQETQKSTLYGHKHVLFGPANKWWQNFVNFQRKHSGRGGWPTLLGKISLRNIRNCQKQFHKKDPQIVVFAISCYWKTFRAKHIFEKNTFQIFFLCNFSHSWLLY